MKTRLILPLIFTLLTTSLLVSSTALGKWTIFIEPYLGFSQMTFTDPSFGFDLTQTTMAAVLGGKGGLNLGNSLIGGFDYHTGGVYFLQGLSREVTQKMFGIGGGIRLETIRLWGGYYFLNEIEDSNLFTKYVGTGIKISVGFEFTSKLSVNLETIINDLKDEKSTLFLSSNPTQASAHVVFISFSAPLEFK